MNKYIKLGITLLTLIILAIGGFKVMSSFNEPNTPAFKDKFTKQFLNEDAETPEGFHLFESGTGKYTILFPEDYKMDKVSYYKKGSKLSKEPNTENVYMDEEGFSPEENAKYKEVNLFLHPGGNVLVDSRINVMLKDIGAPEDTEVDIYEDENKTVYYVEYVRNFHADNGSVDRIYDFHGFIAHNHSKQALYYEQRSKCFDYDTKECGIDFDVEKEMGLEMMKSVTFN